MKNDYDPLQDPRFEDLKIRLKRITGPAPDHQFPERVVSRIHQLSTANHNRRRWLAMAATLMIFLGATWAWLNWYSTQISLPPRNINSHLGPLQTLLQAQCPDGRWTAGEQISHSRYDPAITALAILALLQADPNPLQGSYASAIRSGLDYLVRQQNTDGQVGADFSGSAYTQYLAYKALEIASQLPDADPIWILAAARAKPLAPTPLQMAQLNRHLSRPEQFPSRWLDIGGAPAKSAVESFKR